MAKYVTQLISSTAAAGNMTGDECSAEAMHKTTQSHSYLTPDSRKLVIVSYLENVVDDGSHSWSLLWAITISAEKHQVVIYHILILI